jgi:hypothetical protein
MKKLTCREGANDLMKDNYPIATISTSILNRYRQSSNLFSGGVYPPEKRFDPRFDFGVDDSSH